MLEWTLEEEIAFAELSDEGSYWWEEFDADVAEHLRLLASQEEDKNVKYKGSKEANN